MSNAVRTRGVVVVTMWLALLAGCIPEPKDIAPTPTNLAATSTGASITLTWTSSTGATSYNVKRSTVTGGPYAQLAIVTSATYTDSAVVTGTTYYYVVSSVAADGESLDSAQASATRLAPPPAPTDLVATAGNAQATLTWSASSGAASYSVKRATVTGGPFTQVASPTSTTYTDTPLINDTTYFYVVSAINTGGEGTNSAQVSVTPVFSNPPPTTFGTWTDVTPPGVDLVSTLCSNYGARTVQSDPARPSDLYTLFDCQGIWKSTDYGATWTGPINTGTNGAVMGDCSGGITLARNPAATAPVIYAGCIRGTGLGFWRSIDGGVNWTRYDVAGLNRQDYYAPVVDPYDHNHLLMAGHELPSAIDTIMESIDGGQTWSRVPLDSGMLQNTFSPLIFFINTGSATTTRGTWLWIGQANAGTFGTWRTTNSGAAWVRVDDNQYNSSAQIYQPDNNGVVFMAGAGVRRSRDYGQTWVSVGQDFTESLVFGSSKNVYSMYGAPVGPGGTTIPAFQVSSQPGTGTWVAPGTPAAMAQGPGQVSVVNDGTRNILVGAMWNSGLWRYIEP